MAADLAAPVRDVDTRTPLEPAWGALEERRFVKEPIDPLDRILERDEGRADWIVSGIPERRTISVN